GGDWGGWYWGSYYYGYYGWWYYTYYWRYRTIGVGAALMYPNAGPQTPTARVYDDDSPAVAYSDSRTFQLAEAPPVVRHTIPVVNVERDAPTRGLTLANLVDLNLMVPDVQGSGACVNWGDGSPEEGPIPPILSADGTYLVQTDPNNPEPH